MGPDVAPGGSHPRVGLVLGAGGVLGAAWMTGALPALQERLPCPLADVDLVVGTSAGSVLAAALRCGVSIEEMIAAPARRGHRRGWRTPVWEMSPAARGHRHPRCGSARPGCC